MRRTHTSAIQNLNLITTPLPNCSRHPSCKFRVGGCPTSDRPDRFICNEGSCLKERRETASSLRRTPRQLVPLRTHFGVALLCRCLSGCVTNADDRHQSGSNRSSDLLSDLRTGLAKVAPL